MTLVHRVLPPHPYQSLQEYLARGGGVGLAAARVSTPQEIIATLTASGLRGRGGAGFPTGAKWQTVLDYASTEVPTTVVINAAEGEPGTYKDRTLLQYNPFEVLEGAVIAALAVDATRIIVAVKRSFTEERSRVEAAIEEFRAAGLLGHLTIDVVAGPDEYLFGEETALLEVTDGRLPFPRIAPPYRRGVDEVVAGDADVTSGSGLSAHVRMAGPDSSELAPPALVDNVETMANIAKIIARGAEWFRTEGTQGSAGTIVCTVTGAVRRPGVGEVLLGTTIREAIEEIAGGPAAGTSIKAVLNGVSAAPILAYQLDTPMSYEGMAAIGSSLGTASLHVLPGDTDMTSVAAGIARFLAVESCGQCVPCKVDGLAIDGALERLCGTGATAWDVELLRQRLTTVADGARCGLGRQQQTVIGAIVDTFADEIEARIGAHTPLEPLFVSELRSLHGGVVELDERRRDKQPDWSFGAEWSGASPADEFADHRSHRHPPT
ncbi:MAG TPA: NADH-ubiquinone oxidoreductase-F iron-sulfur binding region domain-containing protein [Ilumatobacteraceae bacterium]|nr:NADH-ubiquinone oxidoreductase-F iron-sulfur binding region domain-containing protein [Ilumatobacteraceae bacterium]